jgi:hypothetical protein
MLRWTGFADFCFEESAHLALARAQEQEVTDAYTAAPEAWLVDDRRITFSLQTESALSLLEGTKRLLAALSLQAASGEAVIEIAPSSERWVRHAGAPPTSATVGYPEEDYEGAGETIRTAS